MTTNIIQNDTKCTHKYILLMRAEILNGYNEMRRGMSFLCRKYRPGKFAEQHFYIYIILIITGLWAVIIIRSDGSYYH